MSSRAFRRWMEVYDENRHLRAEIDRLAVFLAEHVPGEPSRDESAVDTAIRLLRAGLQSEGPR